MADAVGTVRVELVADPSGIQRGIEQAGAALTRFAAIGAFVGNIAAAAFQSLASKLQEAVTGLLDGTSELSDRISDDTQNAVTLLGNSLNRISDSGQNALATILDRILPGLARVVDAFSRSETATSLATVAIELLVLALKLLLIATVAVVSSFLALAEAIGTIAQAVAHAIRGEWAQAGQAIAAGAVSVQGIWRRAGALISDIWNETAVRANEAGPALQRASELGAGALRRLQAEGRRVFEATRTPFEALEERMRRLGVLLQMGIIDWDTYQRAVNRAREVVSQTQKVLRDVAQAFETAFVDAVTGAKSLSDALKNLLSDLAKIFARATFRQLLFAMFGNNPNMSGLFGGGLFANAQGGLYKVAGAGGVDSQVVALRASPGENVAVWNDSQAGPAGAGNGGPPRVIVNNYSRGEVASRTDDDKLELTVRGIVRDEFGSARMNPLMSGKYGLRPRVRAR